MHKPLNEFESRLKLFGSITLVCVAAKDGGFRFVFILKTYLKRLLHLTFANARDASEY